MKRFVAIWLTVALLCLLFGCVSHDPKTDGDGTTTSTKATTTAPTNNPQVGLKFEQEYVGTYRESADLLQTTTIRFDPNEKGSCILTDYWYYSEEIFPNLPPFEHEGKTWYTGGSGEKKYFCELTDGQVLRDTVRIAKGDSTVPLSEEEILQKYRRLSEPVMGRQKSERLLDTIWNIENVDDLSSFFS